MTVLWLPENLLDSLLMLVGIHKRRPEKLVASGCTLKTGGPAGAGRNP
jgi:hypothetical protein